MKKKSLVGKSFKDSREMDQYLEKTDLGRIFEQYGKIEKPQIRKINLDLPEWVLTQLDFEAARAGISRQPLIKMWLIQKLDDERKKRV